ncbi:MAG: DUF134 domain-containing protein [Candidatus Omnitrophota bacterium]
MRPRGRPTKYRLVKNSPKISLFSPRGKPGRPDEIELKIDEFETLRLADFLGQKQKEAAKSMGVSQQTFSRILKRARSLTAEALVTGKIIKIQGGQYILNSRQNPSKSPIKQG